MPNWIDLTIEYIGIGIASIIILGFAIQKFISNNKITKAELSVCDLMHEELTRISAQNKALSTELGLLQKDIISLNKELRTLTLENQKLRHEVVLLTEEVGRLETSLINAGAK